MFTDFPKIVYNNIFCFSLNDHKYPLFWSFYLKHLENRRTSKTKSINVRHTFTKALFPFVDYKVSGFKIKNVFSAGYLIKYVLRFHFWISKYEIYFIFFLIKKVATLIFLLLIVCNPWYLASRVFSRLHGPRACVKKY